LTNIELMNQYFDWMYQLVANDRYLNKSYRKLFAKLHNTEFVYLIPMDGNRAEDGIDLRYRFGREHSYDISSIESFITDYPCSVLEMMVALSIRCEEHIMYDPDVGDRTGTWFWGMVESLGLVDMDDANFDRDFVDNVLTRFLERDYDCNGRGGLFTVKNRRCDMRSVEIWYQLCWYLDELI